MFKFPLEIGMYLFPEAHSRMLERLPAAGQHATVEFTLHISQPIAFIG